jgi:hypothetical protein
MKRSWLATVTLVVTTALAAPAPALATTRAGAGLSGLPTAASLTDPKHDGMSRRFDIFWIRGAKVGKNLALTMRVRNLTPANTRVVQTPDLWWHQYAGFSFRVRINGQKAQAYTFANDEHRGQVGLRNERSSQQMTCAPDGSEGLGNGTRRVLHFKTDTVRLIVPLSCLPHVRKVSVSGYSSDGWSGDVLGGKMDFVNRRGTRHLPRYTPWFKVR